MTMLSSVMTGSSSPCPPYAVPILPAGKRTRDKINHRCSSHACRVRLRTTSSNGMLRVEKAWEGGGYYSSWPDSIAWGLNLPTADEKAG